MRSIVSVAILIAAPACAAAQGAPGKNLTVDVSVIAVATRADTVEVAYSLMNHVASVEQVFFFTVDAPAGVVTISRPQPHGDWLVGTVYRGRAVAEWTVLGEQMAPGETSPTLSFESRGLPGIVQYWIGGYFPPPALSEADTIPVVEPGDPLIDNAITGVTVGVEPIPTSPSANNLVLRLRELVSQSCGVTGWITSAGVCAALDGLLVAASEAIGESDYASAQIILAGFKDELEEHRGNGVNDNAYWLLKVNASIVLAEF